MIKSGALCLLGFLLWSAGLLHAQELLLDELPALRDKAIVLQITTKIQENNQELGTSFNSRVTIPGRPVAIKMMGGNCIIEIRFVLNPQQTKFTLVAQSQIWIGTIDKGISYKTTSHSIPIGFGEPVLFFPLGSNPDPGNPHIELLLAIYRYGEAPEKAEPAEPGTEATEPPAIKEAPAGKDR